jgi:hypothetical protein
VLLVGIVFGVLDVRPIPAILLAQALNGLLLPLAAVFLLVAINDRELMGERVNGAVANAVAALVVGVSVLLGLRQVLSAAAKTFDLPVADGRTVYALALVTAAGLAWPVGRWILAGRAR